MKLISLHAENFLSYKNLDFNFTKRGLTLIEGCDEDLNVSTGAGKSSLLDAISYAMFGETSKNIKADEAINRQTGKNLYVSLLLEDSGVVYEIRRIRKHDVHGNDLVLIMNGELERRGKTVIETQQIIEQELGCTFSVFNRSVYFSQFSSVDRFLSASDTDKKALISEICSLSYYDEVLEKVKKVYTKLEKEQNQISQAIAISEAKKITLTKRVEDSKQRIQAWLSSHTSKIKEATAKRDYFNSSKLKTIASLEEYNRSSQVRIDSLNNAIEQKRELTNIPNHTEEKAKINSQLQVISKLEQRRGEVNLEVFSAERDLKAIKPIIAAERAKIAQNSSSECYNCYQPISAEHIQKHIDVLVEKENKLNTYLVEKQALFAKINEAVKVKAELSIRLIEISQSEQRAQSAMFEVESLTRDCASIKSTIDRNLQDIERQRAIENPYFTLVNDLESEKNPFEGQAVDITAEMKLINQEIVNLSEHLHKKGTEFGYACWWHDALKVYIKSYLMDSFLEQINLQANEYLETLFDGVLKIEISAVTENKKEVKEKIKVIIYNGNEECSYDSLSGGERCRVCLAVNLSISDLACKVSQKSFNILMMDEIFTGLDEHGKNQTMKLLKELEDRFDSIFVIDHTEAFKSMFTNNITVIKRSGVSHLSV